MWDVPAAEATKGETMLPQLGSISMVSSLDAAALPVNRHIEIAKEPDAKMGEGRVEPGKTGPQ